MDKFINLELLKHPLNWITVFLMLTIFGIAFDVIAKKFEQE